MSVDVAFRGLSSPNAAQAIASDGSTSTKISSHLLTSPHICAHREVPFLVNLSSGIVRRERSLMDKDSIALICLSVFGSITILGILWTKTPGWGRYSTSTLILALALFIGTTLLVLGKLEGQIFANIIFAIIGYAGGLIGKSQTTDQR